MGLLGRLEFRLAQKKLRIIRSMQMGRSTTRSYGYAGSQR